MNRVNEKEFPVFQKEYWEKLSCFACLKLRCTIHRGNTINQVDLFNRIVDTYYNKVIK